MHGLHALKISFEISHVLLDKWVHLAEISSLLSLREKKYFIAKDKYTRKESVAKIDWGIMANLKLRYKLKLANRLKSVNVLTESTPQTQ